MTALQAVVEDATDFLKAISASEAKDALVAAISEGQAVYASEASTVDDIEAARQAWRRPCPTRRRQPSLWTGNVST